MPGDLSGGGGKVAPLPAGDLGALEGGAPNEPDEDLTTDFCRAIVSPRAFGK